MDPLQPTSPTQQAPAAAASASASPRPSPSPSQSQSQPQRTFIASRKDRPRLIRPDGKRKRRSRNDNDGRVYKCKDCGRTYLSNSALFNHRRIKHVSLRHTAAVPVAVASSSASSGGGGGGNGGLHRKQNRQKEGARDTKGISHGLQVRAVSASFFDTSEARGGPTHVIYGFEEAYGLLLRGIDKYDGYERHPLFEELDKLHSKLRTQLNYEREHGEKAEVLDPSPLHSAPAKDAPPPPSETGIVTANLPASAAPAPAKSVAVIVPPATGAPPAEPSPTDSKEIKQTYCDAVFAEYLAEVARKVNKNYYKRLTRFVLLYRECLNEYGFIIGKTKRESKLVRNQEYCLICNTELAPEIANEVVAVCLDQPHMEISHKDAVALTLNLCNWLLANDYTSMMLTLGRRV